MSWCTACAVCVCVCVCSAHVCSYARVMDALVNRHYICIIRQPTIIMKILREHQRKLAQQLFMSQCHPFLSIAKCIFTYRDIPTTTVFIVQWNEIFGFAFDGFYWNSCDQQVIYCSSCHQAIVLPFRCMIFGYANVDSRRFHVTNTGTSRKSTRRERNQNCIFKSHTILVYPVNANSINFYCFFFNFFFISFLLVRCVFVELLCYATSLLPPNSKLRVRFCAIVIVPLCIDPRAHDSLPLSKVN